MKTSTTKTRVKNSSKSLKRRRKSLKTRITKFLAALRAHRDALTSNLVAWVQRASKSLSWGFQELKKVLPKLTLVLLALGAAYLVAPLGLSGKYNTAAIYSAKDSVVMLTPVSDPQMGGTGFVLETAKGLFTITNAHVCEISVDGTLLAHVDQKPRQILKILRIDTKVDLCMLEPVYGVKGLTMGAADVSDYDTVFTWGHPGLRPVTVEQGKAMPPQLIQIFTGFVNNGVCEAGLPYSVTVPHWGTVEVCILTQMARASTVRTYGGSSGSPVFNRYGDVVGVIFAGDTETNNGYWVEFGELRAFLNS